ncbi:MAG: hypothetical protein J6V07_00890 [Clostridia bacterium]|nr:hypothetical protein [Clostridia bacterium]
MQYNQDPHIVSTENTLFLDENGNVIPNPYDTGYDEPEEVSYKRRIGVLEREEAALLEKIEAFCEGPGFTEKQKQLIEAYRKDGRASSFFGRIKYRSIRAVFIEPLEKLEAKLSEVRRELVRFRGLYLSAVSPLTTEQLDRYSELVEQEAEIDLDYIINGNRGDRTE